METFTTISWIGVQIFLLWLLADLFTGSIHWFEDTYGNPYWPVIGKYIVQPNLLHHQDPRALTRGSYWNKVDTSVVAGIILIIFFWFVCGWHSWRMILWLAFSAQGNQVHAWAHQSKKENGQVVTFFQKTGIFLKPKSHGAHHKNPYNTSFCIMTEFLNPVLNKVQFWKNTEYVLRKIGLHVLRGSEVREGR